MTTTSRYYPDFVPDPIACVDGNGKPIFDLSYTHKYEVKDKDLSDTQKLAYKTFQLYRTTLKVERRDNVFQALTSTDSTSGTPKHFWMGTPWPIIEPNPHLFEVFTAIRWYEHVIAVASGVLYYQWIRARPTFRYNVANWYMHRLAGYCIFGLTDLAVMGFRSYCRLLGMFENVHEGYKYGVYETPERLKFKHENWKRFEKYKEEWMKRWDYYMWAMRPGERFSPFAVCVGNPYPISYNRIFDYPMRKNVYWLSAAPISEFTLDSRLGQDYVFDDSSPVMRQRPELKYLWTSGP